MFTLKISTANASFEKHEYQEIARILQWLASGFADASASRDQTIRNQGKLRDSNGNTVGKWELK